MAKQMFNGKPIKWEGNGIYYYSILHSEYRRIKEMDALENFMSHGVNVRYVVSEDLIKGD